MELDVAYIDLEENYFKCTNIWWCNTSKEALEILYKDKLNELKNGN